MGLEQLMELIPDDERSNRPGPDGSYLTALYEKINKQQEELAIAALASISWENGEATATDPDELKTAIYQEAWGLAQSTGGSGQELALACLAIGIRMVALHPAVAEAILEILQPDNLRLAASSAHRIAAGPKANLKAAEAYGA